MPLPDIQLSEQATHIANDLLAWVGFGTLAGLTAKAIMPGRDPGGAVATLLIGIAGTFIGGGIMMYFADGQRVVPISPLGFVLATAGAFILLFFYRLLSGRLFTEGETQPFYRRSGYQRHRAHVRSDVY